MHGSYIAQSHIESEGTLILLYIALNGDCKVRQIQILLDRFQAPILQSHIQARIDLQGFATIVGYFRSTTNTEFCVNLNI